MTRVARSPAISVLIASYGAEAFIERAIRSVLAQTLADLEILVIDDASPDDSAAIVAGIAARDERVRLVRLDRNGGPAAARNRGISEARGRWLAIVDSDDLLARDRFAELVAAAEAADVDMIADDLLVFEDGRPASATRFLSDMDRRAGEFDLALGEYLRRSVLYGPEPNPGFLKPLIRRTRLLAAGVRYDERLRIAEDDDLVVRLLLAGLRYRVIARPGYFYRKHEGSISHRLTPSALEAMAEADRALSRRVTEARPELARRARVRSRSYERALAFERMILALRRRDPVRAAMLAIAHPSALPLLRMPVAGLVRRVRGRPVSPATICAPEDELSILTEQRDAFNRS